MMIRLVVVACTFIVQASAFTVTHLVSPTTSSTAVRALPPDFIDPHHVEHALQVHSAFLESSYRLLADAAVAEEDPGWFKTGWSNYLSLFKGALTTLHSTIDGPLKSVGMENTWGPSIALFTFCARSVLIPFSIQQTKSAEYMKVLKPYISEISERFKDNEDAKNRAIGKLYEDADQNPLAGCFTSLAQLPIFLGLYRGVRLLAQEGSLDESFLWIPSLQGPVSPPDYRGLDWLTLGWTSSADGFPTPSMGWETTLAYLAMPLTLVVLQSITLKALQPPVDENMGQEEKEQMEKSTGFLKFLPLLIGFFSLQVPAGLTIYWFTSNIFTLSQSLAVRAYFAANPPKIELPEYWDSALEKRDFKDMTPEERRKASEAGIRVGPTFQDMMDEAKFHCVVERLPLRQDSLAWKRLQEGNADALVPPELEDWVAAETSAAQPISA
jgi:YidC/Oxa1 family membrane protein insertase